MFIYEVKIKKVNYSKIEAKSGSANISQERGCGELLQINCKYFNYSWNESEQILK